MMIAIGFILETEESCIYTDINRYIYFLLLKDYRPNDKVKIFMKNDLEQCCINCSAIGIPAQLLEGNMEWSDDVTGMGDPIKILLINASNITVRIAPL